jgi:hypothetical protein
MLSGNMDRMSVVPSQCPYCGYIISAIAYNKDLPLPKEDDVTLCMTCGEFMLFGPFLTPFKKCDLTPDQMADKLGLLIYGTLLQIQEQIKNS